jgi:hypothetical protein
MMRRTLSLATYVFAFQLCALTVSAQEGPPAPSPGPEHEMLKRDVGVWDATVEMFGPPGAPAMTSKGTETNAMVGAFWLVSQFKSEMMGQPFEGQGTTGYDPLKKKFVGTWIDSLTPGLATVESTYDAKTRTMTGFMVGPDPASKLRETTEWKTPDLRVFTMYGPKGPDGKEPVMMKITYTRRK